MKYIKQILITLVFITLLSCGKGAKPIPITLVFDTALEGNKYPDYFKQIVMPFSSTNCDADYLLKPINVVRLDIKKAAVETNAWYFEQMGDNTVEFSKTWLTHYFKDSLMPKHLTIAAKKTINDKSLDSYLSKTDILTLIYSEESDEEEYNDHKIFTSGKEINSKIQESLCDDKYKEVVILINPKKLKSVSAPIINNTDKITTSNPCEENSTSDALDLKDRIREIVNTKRSLKQRLSLAEKVWGEYFTENAYVALYQNRQDKNPDVWNPGSGKEYFTNRLAMLESILSVAIFKIEFSKENKKISGIHIIECQNVSVSL